MGLWMGMLSRRPVSRRKICRGDQPMRAMCRVRLSVCHRGGSSQSFSCIHYTLFFLVLIMSSRPLEIMKQSRDWHWPHC